MYFESTLLLNTGVILTSNPPTATKLRSRQNTFNERLVRLFQKNGEMVARQALLADLSEFTPMEVDQCLATLSNVDKIMVTEDDGMIYKI